VLLLNYFSRYKYDDCSSNCPYLAIMTSITRVCNKMHKMTAKWASRVTFPNSSTDFDCLFFQRLNLTVVERPRFWFVMVKYTPYFTWSSKRNCLFFHRNVSSCKNMHTISNTEFIKV